MTRRFNWVFAVSAGFALLLNAAIADDRKSPPKSNSGANEVELVEQVLSARKQYQQSLANLYELYVKTGDKERAKWVEDELKGFHLIGKPSYRLDVQDVPPPTLEAKENIKEANDLFKQAMDYKGKGFGTELMLNQRRTEILLREILEKYPTSDIIADVAYELGDLYEGKAFKQYGRSAAYFERAFQWRKGSRSDARMRAAKLYDKTLNERAKAIELYRDVIAHDTDDERIKVAQKRLAELTSVRR
ncbi:MAG TPA: hypothetical protein VGJ05_22010 [Fimbriiglobus sp.]|jgi:hypothetical protein